MSKNSISASACVIAACHVMVAKNKRWEALIPAQDLAFYQYAYEYCRTHLPMCRVLDRLPLRHKLWLVERMVAVGAAQHFPLRKKAIAEQVQAAIVSGVRQLVVLGGGFDLLAFNTAKQGAGTQCFEVDTPAMHAHKLHVLQPYFGSVPESFHAVAADLAKTSLKDALLAQPAFDRTRPTMFIGEGLMMYLSSRDIEQLFIDFRELGVSGSSLVLTAIENHRDAKKNWAHYLRAFILSSGAEMYGWSMSFAHIEGFLSRQGFTVQRKFSYADLQRPWRSAEEMQTIEKQNGEYIVYALRQ